MKKKITQIKYISMIAACLLFQLLFLDNRKSWALEAGDIAVIGLNCDPNTSLTKSFAVVALAEIPPSQIIYFSDKAYYSGSFGPLLGNGSEGRFEWSTPTSAIPAGTVIMFSITSGASPSVTTTPATGACSILEGWTSTSATVSPFGQNGDNMLIYQGTESAPLFIYGFNSGNNNTGVVNGWQTGVSSNPNGVCELPAGLTAGTTAVGFGGAAHADNLKYNGITTGTKAVLLSAIGNTSNWISDDATAHDLVPGSGINNFTVTGALPITLHFFRAHAQEGKVELSWETSDAVNFSHFEIERSSNGSSFAGIFQKNAAVDAGVIFYQYFDREASSQAMGNRLFYRLKMIDLDGSFTYSTIVPVYLLEGSSAAVPVRLRSNPFTSSIGIELATPEPGLITLELLDIAGINLLQKKVAARNTTTIIFDGLGPLKSGTYLLRVKAGNAKAVTLKVVKQ